MDALDSVVLHFFVGTSGELRCRATDVASRRTWIVPGARIIHELLRSEPLESAEKEQNYER